MHRLFLIALFALVGLLDPAWAQTQNMKTYGNCQTVTLPEPDGARYLVACSTDETIIGVAQALGTLTVMVGIGYQAHGGAQMSMTIRIDSGRTISRDALWDAQTSSAYTQDTALALRLLPALAQGRVVHITVGDRSGIVRLDGSSRAIQDFRHRTGLQP